MKIAIATTLVAFCILQTVAAPPPLPPPPYKEAQQLSKPTGFKVASGLKIQMSAGLVYRRACFIAECHHYLIYIT